MTSIPASRSARAMIFAPRSWPSRPGFATTTRIFLLAIGAAGYPVARRLPADASGWTRLAGVGPAVHGDPQQDHQRAEYEQRSRVGPAVRKRGYVVVRLSRFCGGVACRAAVAGGAAAGA